MGLSACILNLPRRKREGWTGVSSAHHRANRLETLGTLSAAEIAEMAEKEFILKSAQIPDGKEPARVPGQARTPQEFQINCGETYLT